MIRNCNQELRIIRLKPSKAQAGIGIVQYRVLHPITPMTESHNTLISSFGDDIRKLIGGEQLVA